LCDNHLVAITCYKIQSTVDPGIPVCEDNSITVQLMSSIQCLTMATNVLVNKHGMFTVMHVGGRHSKI